MLKVNIVITLLIVVTSDGVLQTTWHGVKACRKRELIERDLLEKFMVNGRKDHFLTFLTNLLKSGPGYKKGLLSLSKFAFDEKSDTDGEGIFKLTQNNTKGKLVVKKYFRQRFGYPKNAELLSVVPKFELQSGPPTESYDTFEESKAAATNGLIAEKVQDESKKEGEITTHISQSPAKESNKSQILISKKSNPVLCCSLGSGSAASVINGILHMEVPSKAPVYMGGRLMGYT